MATYLTRTCTGGSFNTKYTVSFWFKLTQSDDTKEQYIYMGGDQTTSNNLWIRLQGTARTLYLRSRTSASNDLVLITNRVFRDSSAWYHVVYEIDTTLSTASDRVKLYINGVQETSFGTETYPGQNTTIKISNNGDDMDIGRRTDGSGYSDMNLLLAHFHIVDGTAYPASTFGETDSTTGIWKPKTSPSVTYGTNGCFLKFENSGSMGTDSSGNSNTFTVNGTITQTIDTPSNVFATLNPLDNAAGVNFTLSNGNTTLGDNGTGDNDKGLRATLGVSSGKYYWEVKRLETGGTVGILGSEVDIRSGDVVNNASSNSYHVGSNGSGSSMVYWQNGSFVNNSALQGWAANDIVGVALDMDNGKLFLSINGVFKGFDNNTSDPANGTNANFTGIATDGTIFIPYVEKRGTANPSDNYNFGNGYFGTTAVSSAQNPDDGIGIFEYDVPTGYRALCTKSINAEEYS